jgi:hypothetical protein
MAVLLPETIIDTLVSGGGIRTSLSESNSLPLPGAAGLTSHLWWATPSCSPPRCNLSREFGMNPLVRALLSGMRPKGGGLIVSQWSHRRKRAARGSQQKRI